MKTHTSQNICYLKWQIFETLSWILVSDFAIAISTYTMFVSTCVHSINCHFQIWEQYLSRAWSIPFQLWIANYIHIIFVLCAKKFTHSISVHTNFSSALVWPESKFFISLKCKIDKFFLPFSASRQSKLLAQEVIFGSDFWNRTPDWATLGNVWKWQTFF